MNRQWMRVGVIVLGALMAQTGLSETKPVPVVVDTPDSFSCTGRVVETMNASRYTYVLIDTGKDKIWAASPTFAVKAGDTVSFSGGMATRDFASAVLKRKFDLIYLVGHIVTPGDEVPVKASGKHNLPAGHPSIETSPDLPANLMDFSEVKTPEGGKTIADIVTNKAKLAGKPVVVRGKVVKVVPDIMGKNWLHLRDGTSRDGVNDLTVTTSDLPALGTVVTVTGILGTHIDFGSGYQYDVIIQDAAVSAR